MKKTISIATIFLLIFSACRSTRTQQATTQPADEYTNEEVTYQTFYDGLSPYGNWIDYPGVGYAWTPNESGFRPYSSNGYWAYSNAGWTWVSNYRWGWAAFHYGRWFNDPFYGWIWAPGYEWAPAWVNWRGNNEMYGWAPMAPSGLAGYNNIPYDQWTFVPGQHINDHNGHQYYQNGTQVYINNTTIINNYNDVPVVRNPRNPREPVNGAYNNVRNTYAAGPPVREVEKITNSTIMPLQIQNRKTPEKDEVTANSIQIYKPQVKGQQANQPQANTVRPASVMPYKKEPVPQNNINNQAQQPIKSNEREPIQQPDPKMNQPVPDNNKAPQPANNEVRMPVVKQPDPRLNQPVTDNTKQPQPINNEVKMPVAKQPDPRVNQPIRENNKIPQNRNQPVRPQPNTLPQRRTPAPVQQPPRTPNPVYRKPANTRAPQTIYPKQFNTERAVPRNQNNPPAMRSKKPV